MTSSEEKTMEENSTIRKRKMTAQASFDDELDLDGFSELDKLDPVETQQSHSAQSSAPSCSSTSNPVHNGPILNGLTTASPSIGHPSSQPPPQRLNSQQGPNSVGPIPQQPSVLTELLLNQTSASSMNNSPRQASYSSGNFPTKSPMPPSMSSTSTSQSQNISQMSMAQQRISAAQQQMRQPMTGYDPNIAQPSTSMPPGSYNIQQGQQQLMAGPPPSQQQFASYQQHPRQAMYGGSNSARMTHSGALPQQNIRQGFPPNMSQQGPQPMLKDVRQQPHPGVVLSNAPTPPTQGRAALMMGQNLVGQNVTSFDGGNHQQFQQIAGPINGGPPQRQPFSESNGYMLQGGQLINTSVSSQQQMPSFMNSGQMQPQHRIPPPMGFASTGHQMMSGPVGESSMIGGPSQQQLGQIHPGSNSQSGILVNGNQIMPGPRQQVPGSVTPQSQPHGIQNSGGMMMNGPGQQMRNQSGPGSVGPPSQQLVGSGHPQDPEKRKLIQQQLVLLLHAHKCQQREKSEPQNRGQCTLPYCNTMKGVLEHMVKCTAGRQCQFPHCASSRQIITHWKNCNKEDCPVCNPVKKYTNQPGVSSEQRQGDMMLNALNFGGGSILQSTPGPSSISMQPQSQISQQPMFGSPPSQATTVNTLLDGYNPNSNPFRSTNPPNKTGQVGQQQLYSSNDGIPPPEPPTQPKDWHASITLDLRNHLVGKLVKAIFPSPDPAAIHDQRIRDLISYSRKVEKDMFEQAPDKEAYYHMLAEKIYKIQKELQEKKNRRLNEQQQQLAQPQQDLQHTGIIQQQMLTVKEIKQEPKIIEQPHQQNNQSQAMMNFVDQIPNKRPKIEEPDIPSTSESTITVKQEPNISNNSSSLFPPSSESSISRRSTTPKETKPSTSTAPQEPIVRDPKIFNANELRSHLLPVWQKLWDSEPECIPFRLPVDPEHLHIPDYFDIIKNPMDLKTIRDGLDQGKYKNPWEVCDHMWLMFENAWLYNRKNTKIHKWCTRLSEIFVEEINPVMRQMGYCCGQKLSFTPLVQFCFGITKNNAACVIARDQPYMMYECTSTSYLVTVSDKYIYCVKCFEALPEKGINLNENTSDPPNWIPKTMFQKMKNDQVDMEPFDNCLICDRKWHRICALNNNKITPEGFICEQCRVEKSRPRPDNKFTAKKLPHCQISRYIEDRVNNFLRQKLSENDPEVEVIIRVLSSSDKEVEVKPQMLKKYGANGYPERFPYRSKAIFAFEVLKDPDTGISTEVCFFGLYVQEYGTNCAQPNQRRVYIAYLDSVHFFQPRHLRTSVYYEILLGYLQYVKRLGYTMAHIWACPPSEGDDYIFHCHPPEQKIPKPKRLQDWYKTMLNNGHEEGTVYSYKDIFNQAKDDQLDTPMRLPYFEGDYWPRIIDECIQSAEKDEEIDKRKQQVVEDISNISDDDTFQTDDGLPVKKQQKASSKKKSNLKKSAQNSKKKGGINTGNPVVDRLFQQLEKHRDVFFTIRLFSVHDEQIIIGQKPRIEDPDPLISCELMDSRDNFLAKSREEHWEFSQLRRAKWSTLNFCYTLHTQEQEGKALGYTCNNCDQAAVYHCNTCDDYDLCEVCRTKIEHPHDMEKLSIVDEQKSSDASVASRNDSVKKCIISLVHACTCRDANCRRGTCHKMKKVIMHTRQCKRRQVAGANCAVCKQLIALCCYHAKHCTLTKCQVPFCLQIRQKLQEQKRSQNRQAERMMQRRMMKLQSSGGMNGSGGGIPPSTSSQQGGPPSGIGWERSSQSPSIIGGQQGHSFGSSQMQQMGGISGSQQGGGPPNIQQPHMRLNGPADFHNIQNQMQNRMVNSPPIGQQSIHHISSQQPGSGYQIIGGPNSLPHQIQHGVGSGIHRVPSAGAIHQQHQLMSQQINPPSYGIRPGSSQQQQSLPFVQQQMGQHKVLTQQQRYQQQQIRSGGHLQSEQQPQFIVGGGIPRQHQQHQMRPHDALLVLDRFKAAQSHEEKEAIFNDLKKTPHLFNAFLKITKKELEGQELVVGGQQHGQQIRTPPSQQQQFIQQQQQQYYQGRQQNGGNAPQFNSPPPQQPQQHQWLQQQQVPHSTQSPSQRNPT